MARLFDRAVQVTVGPKGGTGLKIRDLRIQFNVEKNLEKQPNSGMVKIYNLSRNSRALIEQKDVAIILEAGYGRWIRNPSTGSESFEGDLKTLFVADIARVTTERNGTDIITSIECGDGELPYQNARLDVSFKPGTKYASVLNTVISSMGLSNGFIGQFNQGDQFLNGLSLSGLSRNHMSLLTERQGLSWSIQDDQLQILGPSEATTQTAVLLNKSTGLIGTPYKTKVINQSLLKKKDGKEQESGCKAISLLNAEIRPGRYVVIESENVEGQFKVEKVQHSGDTHAKSYYSMFEAV